MTNQLKIIEKIKKIALADKNVSATPLDVPEELQTLFEFKLYEVYRKEGEKK